MVQVTMSVSAQNVHLTPVLQPLPERPLLQNVNDTWQQAAAC